MGMDVGGPSAMSMYAHAGGQGANPDTGLSTGRQLVDTELAARTHYAAPTVPGAVQAIGGTVSDAPSEIRNGAAPTSYNYMGGQPVKYDVPSAQKEYMQARQAIRKAAALEPVDPNARSNVMRTDPITDQEVQYLQSMKDQAELADFDRYVNSLIDPRKPGNLKWLMEIYPDYVNRRIQQVHTDYEFALRNQMIDNWGINTFDDLHFKYMVDQGPIDGPRLGRHREIDDAYAPGLLSWWAFASSGENRENEGLFLPFASALDGRNPGADKSRWRMSDAGQPMGTGRTTQELANSLYADPANGGIDYRPTSSGIGRTTRMPR